MRTFNLRLFYVTGGTKDIQVEGHSEFEAWRKAQSENLTADVEIIREFDGIII